MPLTRSAHSVLLPLLLLLAAGAFPLRANPPSTPPKTLDTSASSQRLPRALRTFDNRAVLQILGTFGSDPMEIEITHNGHPVAFQRLNPNLLTVEMPEGQLAVSGLALRMANRPTLLIHEMDCPVVASARDLLRPASGSAQDQIFNELLRSAFPELQGAASQSATPQPTPPLAASPILPSTFKSPGRAGLQPTALPSSGGSSAFSPVISGMVPKVRRNFLATLDLSSPPSVAPDSTPASARTASPELTGFRSPESTVPSLSGLTPRPASARVSTPFSHSDARQSLSSNQEPGGVCPSPGLADPALLHSPKPLKQFTAIPEHGSAIHQPTARVTGADAGHRPDFNRAVDEGGIILDPFDAYWFDVAPSAAANANKFPDDWTDQPGQAPEVHSIHENFEMADAWTLVGQGLAQGELTIEALHQGNSLGQAIVFSRFDQNINFLLLGPWADTIQVSLGTYRTTLPLPNRPLATPLPPHLAEPHALEVAAATCSPNALAEPAAQTRSNPVLLWVQEEPGDRTTWNLHGHGLDQAEARVIALRQGNVLGHAWVTEQKEDLLTVSCGTERPDSLILVLGPSRVEIPIPAPPAEAALADQATDVLRTPRSSRRPPAVAPMDASASSQPSAKRHKG